MMPIKTSKNIWFQNPNLYTYIKSLHMENVIEIHEVDCYLKHAILQAKFLPFIKDTFITKSFKNINGHLSV